MRNVTSRTTLTHLDVTITKPCDTSLFPLIPSFVSATCRSTWTQWRVFGLRLPRNGGANVPVSNNSALYKHSFVELYIYMLFIETIESVSRRSNSVPLIWNARQGRNEARIPSVFQIELFHRQELITSNFHGWKKRGLIEEPETWLKRGRYQGFALIPAINSST